MESTQNEESDNTNNSHSNRIVKFGYVMLIIVGVMLLFSLFTSFMSGYKQISNQYESISPSPNLTLDVIYPSYLLLDTPSSPFMMTLTVADSAIFTQPLTMTLVLPSSIVMSDTTRNEWVFEEKNGRYQKTTFFIESTGVLTGILPPLVSQTLTLTTNSLVSKTTSLPIHVEATLAAASRQFTLGLLQDKSPLLLTIVAFLPIAALVLQQLQKREERETAVREQQLTTQKQNLLEHITQLQRYLSEANRAGVEYTWQQINKPLLKATISPREYDWMTQLVHLCLTGELIEEAQLDEIKNEWTSELVGALLSAENSIVTNSALYRPLFRDILLYQVADHSVRNQFIQLWCKIEPIPLQSWVQEIPIKPNTIQESPLPQTRLHDVLKADPLLHDRTENEEINLFEQDGFWFEHPAYSVVANAVQIQMVVGQKGCGRTALAKGLCYNESRWSRYFWHYRPIYSGLRDISTLRIELVEQLLHYVITRPTLLLPLQEQQRHLLAEVLVDALPKQQVLALLERAIANEPWLQNAKKEQRTVWQDVGNTELALLLQAVKSTIVSPPLTELQWAKVLFTSFQALNFHGVRLVLDCASGSSEAIATLLPTLQEWQQSGLITTLFVPDGASANIADVTVALTWSQTELEALFAHRLLRLANFPLPQAPFASDSVYNSFMAEASAVSATPRKMVHLWQAVLANLGDEEAISMDVLHKAADILRKRDEEESTAQAGREYNLERLQALMDELFNDEEIRSLCMALSVDYDNLSGTNKRGKIRELVLLMSRSGRLPELVKKCQELRPLINWG